MIPELGDPLYSNLRASSMDEIKACPFCSSVANVGIRGPLLKRGQVAEIRVAQVFCHMCGASGPQYGENTEDYVRRAIAGWNYRKAVKMDSNYLPPPELIWLYSHCKAIGMTCTSDSGKWEEDIALFTINLKNALNRLTESKCNHKWKNVEREYHHLTQRKCCSKCGAMKI